MADVPPLTHNPHSPDVFADSATGFFVFNGVVRVTFESARVNHTTSPGPIDRVVVGRLVMPIDAAEALAIGLLDFIKKQRAGEGAPQGVTVQ
ncbi:MAG: hypothetical protein P4M09_22855 [Devosia sp.]|nr:hypothetical protein [Devosia sp.]